MLCLAPAAAQTDFFASHPPYLAATAERWDSSLNRFTDVSGNGRHGTLIAGSATRGTGSGNGASNQVEYVQGEAASKIHWPLGSIPSTFTVCSVSRHTSSDTGRILQCTTGNWLHGHWQTYGGATYYDAAGAGNYDSAPVATPSALGISSSQEWVVTCGRNTQVAGQVGTIANGVTTSTAGGGNGNCSLGINDGGEGEYSDWALSRVYVWDYHLPDDAFFGISDALMAYLAGSSVCPMPYNCSSADFLFRTLQCNERAVPYEGNCSCMAGYSGPDGGTCVACEAGKYKPVNGSSPCTLCAAGKFSTSPAQSTCTECSAVFLYISTKRWLA